MQAVRSLIIGMNGWSNLAGVIAGQLYKAKYGPHCRSHIKSWHVEADHARPIFAIGYDDSDRNRSMWLPEHSRIAHVDQPPPSENNLNVDSRRVRGRSNVNETERRQKADIQIWILRMRKVGTRPKRGIARPLAVH
jgi:hypothetical protein